MYNREGWGGGGYLYTHSSLSPCIRAAGQIWLRKWKTYNEKAHTISEIGPLLQCFYFTSKIGSGEFGRAID